MLFCLFMIPFVLQGAAFSLDEFVYHRRRGLPRWERIGHPIDTASILGPLFYVLNTDFSSRSLTIFAFMALASCLLVTKDEFVHAELCDAKEQWLHSVLFVLHPLLFVTVGTLWFLESIGASPVPTFITFRTLIAGQAAFMSAVMVYQIIYWGFLWQSQSPQLTMKFTMSSVNDGIRPKTTL